MSIRIDCPTASSAVYPNIRSAARCHDVMVLFRSLLAIASSDDSTTFRSTAAIDENLTGGRGDPPRRRRGRLAGARRAHAGRVGRHSAFGQDGTRGARALPGPAPARAHRRHRPAGIDGYDLMRRVRESEHRTGRQRTPAAALTAYSTAQDRKDALLAGFNIYLTKPVDLDELAMIVLSLAGQVSPPSSRPERRGGASREGSDVEAAVPRVRTAAPLLGLGHPEPGASDRRRGAFRGSAASEAARKISHETHVQTSRHGCDQDERGWVSGTISDTTLCMRRDRVEGLHEPLNARQTPDLSARQQEPRGPHVMSPSFLPSGAPLPRPPSARQPPGRGRGGTIPWILLKKCPLSDRQRGSQA